MIDFVYSYDALEHIADPVSAVAELIRIIRPGGLIFLKIGRAITLHGDTLLPYFATPVCSHPVSGRGIDSLRLNDGRRHTGTNLKRSSIPWTNKVPERPI